MNKKLYIGNLPFSADDASLKAFFQTGGFQATSVKIMMDRETGRSRGFAFVELASPEDAQKALGALNGKDFMGRALAISEAREPAPRVGGFAGAGGGFRGPRPNGPPGMGSGPPNPAAIDPEPTDRGGRAKREHGKDRDKDRRDRGRGGNWS